MRIKSVVATTLISAAIGFGVGFGIACGGPESPVAPDPVVEYAQCLASPESPLHALAGEPTALEAEATLRAELESGEQTLADIEAALTLYCE